MCCKHKPTDGRERILSAIDKKEKQIETFSTHQSKPTVLENILITIDMMLHFSTGKAHLLRRDILAEIG